MVERLFLAMPWGCLRFVIVGFPDHTHLLLYYTCQMRNVQVEHSCSIQHVYHNCFRGDRTLYNFNIEVDSVCRHLL